MHQIIYVNICTLSLWDIFFYIYSGNTHSQTHTFSFSLFVNSVYTYTIKPIFLENSIFGFFFSFFFQILWKRNPKVLKPGLESSRSVASFKWTNEGCRVSMVPAPLIHYCFWHTLEDMFSPAFSPETHTCLA